MSMPHRTYEKLHRSVRLSGLSMPNVLHIPFYLSPVVLGELYPIYGVN